MTTGCGTSISPWKFKKSRGFVLTTAPKALTTVNGNTVESIRLRNGDIITSNT